jgi:DinB superfamily
MAWPEPVANLWRDLEAVRSDVLKEVERLSQTQADWKPGEKDWSIGEIVHHVTIAEIATGKLTTKLTKEADAAGKLKPFPADLREFRPLSVDPASAAEAPQVVWPERGRPIAGLIADMKSTRERSRQSIDKLGSVDPRPLIFKHFSLGDLDLAQWWRLHAQHEGIHLRQIRDVKAAPGFPKG